MAWDWTNGRGKRDGGHAFHYGQMVAVRYRGQIGEVIDYQEPYYLVRMHREDGAGRVVDAYTEDELEEAY